MLVAGDAIVATVDFRNDGLPSLSGDHIVNAGTVGFVVTVFDSNRFLIRFDGSALLWEENYYPEQEFMSDIAPKSEPVNVAALYTHHYFDFRWTSTIIM